MTEPSKRLPRPPRVWAVVVTALVLTAVAYAVSPTVRHQVRLSATRQPVPFVELYFADEDTARACRREGRTGARSGGTSGVEVAVRSHLDDAAALGWHASVTPSGTDAAPSQQGVFETRPGQVAEVRLRYRAPAAAYTLRVELDGRSEHLVLHCPGTPEAAG